MARVEIPVVVLTPSGGPAGGASVQVDARAGGAATVYAGETGATTLANPLTSDAFGRVVGWLERGAYNLVVSPANNEFTSYTEPFDAAPAGGGAIDNLWLPDGVVDGRTVAAAIKDAAAATASLRTLGAGAAQAAAGNDSRFPTTDQKAALAGNAGVPSATNKYVTQEGIGGTPAAPAWTAVTFANGWVNYGGTLATAAYRKHASGQVEIKGVIKSGTLGTAAFTLPIGLRPLEERVFDVTGTNDLRIASSGTVTPTAGANAARSVEAVFYAEQ